MGQGQAILNARTRSMYIRKQAEMKNALDHAGKLRGDIEASRNSLAHGGFSTTKAGAQNAKGLIDKVKDTQGRFQKLVEMMPDPGSLATQIDAETTGVFLNLSNHPISEWPEAQRLAAERFGQPEDLEDWDGSISPTKEISQVVGLALQYVERIKNMNVTSAFVAGEPSFCTALVALLQAENITCYTTTTERKKVEIPKADGSVFIHSVYEFAGWREYPDLQKLLEP